MDIKKDQCSAHMSYGINCIGVDGKIHTCLPHNDECYCGMKVHRKELKDFDYQTRMWCYECDF